MAQPTNACTTATAAEQILGYANFSEGNHDPAIFRTFDDLFQASRNSSNADANNGSGEPSAGADSAVQQVGQLLRSRLSELTKSKDAFRDSAQAYQVLALVFDHLVPMYQQRHAELIVGTCQDVLFNGFFIARATETAIRAIVNATVDQADAADLAETLAETTFEQFNDYLGHRPIATLETRKVEPYREEWIRPVPILVRDAGVVSGPYQEIADRAFKFLQQTDESILHQAHFDPQRLNELAVDPRAFDFDHPANKRPNYHFGQWDEHSVDNEGYFHRFVIHEVTLDALMERVDRVASDSAQSIDRDQALAEAGAVLAGTILMAAGVSGRGPGAFDSETTLATLLPIIAGYRDQFYTDLLRTLPEAHRRRLQAELKSRQQPFGAARQDLNACLAQRRASQLVNCRLASIYARMGYPDAAIKQLDEVPVASARMICQVDCLLGSVHLSCREGDLETAAAAVPKAVQLLKHGIRCGAIVDPWNILGFDANYSLFPALQNTVRDHRVFELVDLMERMFAVCSELLAEAAAQDEDKLYKSIRNEFLQLVEWWRQFAAHEVMSVDAVDAQEVFEAAQLVAEALNLWHQGGAEAGDISFWSQHAALFDSPKAYSLVITALMQRGDYQTSSALLVHWVSQADTIPLRMGDSSFHQLVDRWISVQKQSLLSAFHPSQTDTPQDAAAVAETPETIWNRIRKFYDFIEANAESYWNVPEFNVGRQMQQPTDDTDEGTDEAYPGPDDQDDDNSLYRAAYDDVTYTDSTDDGMDGDVYGEGADDDNEALEAEVDRVLDRLEFQETVASFWRVSATVPLPVTRVEDLTPVVENSLRRRRAIIHSWLAQAVIHRDQLTDLIESIDQYAIPTTGSNQEAMMLYDQHRAYKDALLEQTIHSSIETQSAIRLLSSVVRAIGFLLDQQPLSDGSGADEEVATTPAGKDAEYELDNSLLISVFSAVLLEEPRQVQEHFESFVACLHRYPLLYVPLARGGDPGSIVCARTLQTHLLDLLQRMPALGLLTETCDLLKTALAMERNNPIGQGAVTEFDELFEVAYSSMVHSLVRSSEQLCDNLLTQNPDDTKDALAQAETQLFDCVQMLTEATLVQWLEHGETLRLSVLEKVFDSSENGPWEKLVAFIQEYGSGLFTQQFLHAGNVRGILHHGVEAWLTEVRLDPPEELTTRLFDDLETKITTKKAAYYLTLVLEAIIENYNEYRDYNTTTTQSDHGGSLYMLLDFLRIKARYDRVSWKLKPVTWAHRILVREQKNNVARMWRKSLLERVSTEADKFQDSYDKLRTKYSMQMSSVGRRIEGRFVHQLQIDRLRSQVAPAMADPTERKSRRSFERLSHEAQAFLRSTNGVGVDLPSWLAALEHEVDQFHLSDRGPNHETTGSQISVRTVAVANLREQLEKLLEDRRSE